ncbi:MAG: alanine racemase, partial [Lachnospiraceae bacterium]|nr:alanine racemase [Lachnospiraceae bacterium]
PEEAAELRRAGIRKPLLLLSYVFEEAYEEMIGLDVRPCVFEEESAGKLSEAAVKAGKTVHVHIAVDTGMGRIGFAPEEESADIVKRIAALPNLEIEGLFTHFARADEEALTPAEVQLQRYLDFRGMLSARGVVIPVSHVSNSAGLMRFQEANLDMVRAGITLYGLMPSDEVAGEMQELQPVMTLKSHVTYVKTMHEGQAVSYGGTWKAYEGARVATVPVGYADGYPRGLSNRGYVLLHGQKAPIVGRVCMDQFMVDVTKIPDVCSGDEVVLLGRQGDEIITAEELGNLSGRFNYELASCITRRVPRCFIRDGAVTEQVDYFL